MLIFAMQIVLTLGLGGIAFLAAKKAPVLLTLPEESPAQKKAILERIKGLNLAKYKERFNIDGLKSRMGNEPEEEGLTRQEEFDQESDYWTRVKKGS